MVRLLFVLDQHILLYDAMATVADVLAAASRLLLQMARVTQGPSSILHKSCIGQLTVTQLTEKALRMPAIVQSLDHTPYHKLIAFPTARSKQDVEIMLAVFPALKLKEDSFWKRPETLGTDKALLMPDLTVRVDNPLILSETGVAPHAHRIQKGHISSFCRYS